MNLYGHMFSEPPRVAISRLPDLPGFASANRLDPAITPAMASDDEDAPERT